MSTELVRKESNESSSSRPPEGAAPGVASQLGPLFASLFPQGSPVAFSFWDGSRLGPGGGPGEVVVHHKTALRRLLWAPGELGLARAYVSGEIDLEGDIYAILASLNEAMGRRPPRPTKTLGALLRVLFRLDLLGPPPPPPAVEVRLSLLSSGWLHSKGRDSEAIRHHYDVGNDFYSLVLGPTMTYSCARFLDGATSLEAAQAAKHELICRKLGLDARPGARLLDVGCGWGSMAIHAAANHGAKVVGVTLSPAQAELARERVEAAGLSDRVEIRLQDYRDLGGEKFDAISSVGMFEHVGSERMHEYFATLYGLLDYEGRLLNHAISKVGGSKMRGRRFINRYVFPDGELMDVAEVVRTMEDHGFEVRDLESLREHYVRTLRFWVANLEEHFEEAAAVSSRERARVWRLYMAASANGFAENSIAVHQVLGVKSAPNGSSGMPLTRRSWG